MNIFIVYCHPSKNSFTHRVKDEFIRALLDTGHSYELSDLYEMNFITDISEEEYLREGFYNENNALPEDVAKEQAKIQAADALVFIYPVFWTEAPAKLVGWFDRVWTYGFAYGENPGMKVLEKVLFIAVAGKTKKALDADGEAAAMQTVMLGDRIKQRAKNKEMIILDDSSRWNMENRNSTMKKHLKTVYNLGYQFKLI